MITKSQLLSVQCEIEDHAREMGFDFYPVLYEMVDYNTYERSGGLWRLSHALSALELWDVV